MAEKKTKATKNLSELTRPQQRVAIAQDVIDTLARPYGQRFKVTPGNYCDMGMPPEAVTTQAANSELEDTDDKETNFCEAWVARYPDPTNRLRAICENIVRNNGTFRINQVEPPAEVAAKKTRSK